MVIFAFEIGHSAGCGEAELEKHKNSQKEANQKVNMTVRSKVDAGSTSGDASRDAGNIKNYQGPGQNKNLC